MGASQLAALRARWTHLCIRMRPTSTELELRFELSNASAQHYQLSFLGATSTVASSFSTSAPQSSSSASGVSSAASTPDSNSYSYSYPRLMLSALGLAPPLLDVELPHSSHLYRVISFGRDLWSYWRTAFLLRVQPGQCLTRRRMLLIYCTTVQLYSYCIRDGQGPVFCGPARPVQNRSRPGPVKSKNSTTGPQNTKL